MRYLPEDAILSNISRKLSGIARSSDTHAKTFGRILAWTVAALAIFFVFFAVRFNGLTDINAQDYAQMARRLSRGDGFTTGFIRPQAILTAPSIRQHPELTSPPLYTIVLAGSFKAFGASDKVVCLTSAFFYLLSVPLFFFAARRFYNRNTALLSLSLYITSAPLLDYSISGLPMSLLIFLSLLLLLAVYALDGRSVVYTILAGVLTGLCSLTQYSFILLLIPLVLHLLAVCDTTEQKIRHSVYLALSCAVTIFPWLCRNLVLTGNPFFTFDFLKPLFFSEIFPGNAILRYARHIDYSFLIVGKTLIKKIYFGVSDQYQQIFFLPQNYLMPLFLVSLVMLSRGKQLMLLKRFAAYALAIFAVVLSIYYPGVNLLAPLIPFVIMAASDFYLTIISGGSSVTSVSRRARAVAIAVFIAVNVYPLVTRIVFGAPPASPYPRERMEKIAQLVGKDDPVVTDIPWAVAWYCDRTAVWLPMAEIDYLIVGKAAGGINNIYLSPILFEYHRTENIELWKNIFMSRRLPRNILLRAATYLPEGGMFLSNEPKWEKLQQQKKEPSAVPAIPGMGQTE